MRVDERADKSLVLTWADTFSLKACVALTCALTLLVIVFYDQMDGALPAFAASCGTLLFMGIKSFERGRVEIDAMTRTLTWERRRAWGLATVSAAFEDVMHLETLGTDRGECFIRLKLRNGRHLHLPIVDERNYRQPLRELFQKARWPFLLVFGTGDLEKPAKALDDRHQMMMLAGRLRTWLPLPGDRSAHLLRELHLLASEES